MDRFTKDILRLVPLFSKFDDESLEKLESFIVEKHYSKGDILFRENSYGNTFYIIKNGSVEIYKEDSKGKKEIILAMRRSGDFFGEMALLENSPRFATARIAADSQILELSKAAFISLLYEMPIAALEIMNVLAARLRQSDTQAIKELREKNISLERMQRELKKSNQRLARTTNFLKRIISVSPDIVLVTDRNEKIYIFNQAARNIYGYTYEEIRGKDISILHSPNCPTESLIDMKYKLKNNETFRGELLDINKDGEEFINYVTVSNIIGGRDNLLGTIYLGKDITEARELERQAQALDRMATRGQMASEVAHELNNYISVIGGNLELLMMDKHIRKNENIVKRINSMSKSVKRMTVFTEGLMSHTGPEYEFAELELNKFLEGELAFLRPQKRFRNIEIITDFDENIDTIVTYAGGLQQILYNLANNAADAINNENIKNGVITVETKFDEELDSVKIKVKDNGPGLTLEQRKNIFRQNFTTKTKGHGFGLMTVKNIVKELKGSISYRSELGKGTEFEVTLPIDQKKKDTTALRESSPIQQVFPQPADGLRWIS